MSLNLLPTVLWEGVPYGDPDAFRDWALPHYLAHVALAKATNTSIMTLDELRDDPFPHAQVHRNLAAALKIADAFDLAGYDLRDKESFENFMLSHALIHAQLNTAAHL